MMLLGRDEERAALAATTARLVTLWGPGGAGKTTLARAEAERLREEGATVVWVDLASARTRGDVATALAAALGLDAAAAAADDVLRAAAASGASFVADNAEQVDREGRALLVALAASQRVLVTSRDALGAAGEEALEVRPLDEASAIALYMRLTNGAEDDVVRAIVRRLDALPLALELAAARAPLLGNAELLARLDRKLDVLKDREKNPRHATLRAAIAWSWDLLAESERSALVVCAQFAAPFDAALAETAAGDDALDDLDALRRRALLHVDAEHRLFLLESVRDFAREHTTTLDRWAEAVLARAEPLALQVRRGERIDPELERRRPDLQRIFDARTLTPATRLRAFLALAATGHDALPIDIDASLASAPTLTPLTNAVLDNARAPEGTSRSRDADDRRARAEGPSRRSDASDAASHDAGDVHAHARDAGGARPGRGDGTATIDRGREAVGVNALGVRVAVAVALALRATGRLADADAIAAAALRTIEQGEAPDARSDASGTARTTSPHEAGDALRVAGVVARSRGGTEEAGDVLRVAGVIARSRGDTERASALLERALAAYRAVGEDAFAGITLGELGVATQSDERLAEGIAVLVATKSLRAEGLFRSHLAVTTHRRGEPRAALSLHEAALAIHRRVGSRRLEGAEVLHRGFVLHELGELAARASIEEARRLLALAGARGLESFANVLLARLLIDEANDQAKNAANDRATNAANDQAANATNHVVEARIALAEAARIAPPGWPRLEATRLLVSGHLAFTLGDRAGAAAAYDASLAASRDVEVGFEALTPAYRALATGEAAPPTPSFKNPHLAIAFALLTGAAQSAPPEAARASSEVRRALAFTAAKRALVVTATSILLPDGPTIDLSRRKNLRLIAQSLARAGSTPVDPDTLIAAGWPGERMRADAATKRLHTAIWTLRKLGLEGILLSSEAGYWLDPALAIELRE
ncbi:MAG: AAA family ATPase [Labilithrix sp.]|nr:AAA family ATPase [Labilithrix sp.]MCW5811151.1 AAA family ATPase [Labilithrix sp.]